MRHYRVSTFGIELLRKTISILSDRIFYNAIDKTAGVISLDVRLILLVKSGIYTIASFIVWGYFYRVYPLFYCNQNVTYETLVPSYFWRCNPHPDLILLFFGQLSHAQCSGGSPGGLAGYDTTIATPEGVNTMDVKFPQFNPLNGMVTCVKLCVTITGIVDSVMPLSSIAGALVEMARG